MSERRLTLGSLFDGSGGFPLAGLLAGIEPIYAAEIEPFPIRVTTKRLPQVEHFGDVSTLNGARLPPVDIITFGSPCQDMSIAGRRAGLDGERSGLFHQAIRIVREMRENTDGEYPRYIVWENVPGAFSSNNGRDFKAVLEAVIGIKEGDVEVPPPEKGRWPYAGLYMGDGWSVAYRVLDAQYWGTAQRRRRVFLVADFGGERAGDILFKPESLRRYIDAGFAAWQAAAGGAGDGASAAGGHYCVNPQGCSGVSVTEDVAGTLVAQDHGNHPAVLAAGFIGGNSVNIGYAEEQSPTLIAGNSRDVVALDFNPTDSRIKVSEKDVSQTLTERMGTGGNNVPLAMTLKIRCGKPGGGKGALVQSEKSATLSTGNDQTLFQPVIYGIGSERSRGMLSDNPTAGIYEAETARTLDVNGGRPDCHQGGMAVVCSATMGGYTQCGEEIAQTLMARDFKDPQIVNTPGYTVRRLTPVECLRLQGLPDWWCNGLETQEPTEEDIAFWSDVFETHRRLVTGATKPKTRAQIVKWLKEPYKDSSAYKMIGNGVALPCVFYVLDGIAGNR